MTASATPTMTKAKAKAKASARAALVAEVVRKHIAYTEALVNAPGIAANREDTEFAVMFPDSELVGVTADVARALLKMNVIDRGRFIVELKRSIYEEAAGRLRVAEDADRQADALALQRAIVWLTIVIAVATFVQAYKAVFPAAAPIPVDAVKTCLPAASASAKAREQTDAAQVEHEPPMLAKDGGPARDR